MSSLLVRHAALLVTMGGARREIEDGTVFARDGVIETVAPTGELPPEMAGTASDFSVQAWIDSLVNGRCDRHIKTGWPDSVVCTAAAKGILLGEPRPALPPWTSPPR